MNIKFPLLAFLVTIATAASTFAQTDVVEITSYTSTPGTNNLGGALAGSFNAVNVNSNNAVNWNVLLEGTDIYGNPVSVPIDAGSLAPLLGVTVNTNGSITKTPQAVNFRGSIPNDGTLYKMAGTGYNLRLYTGTNVTVLSAGTQRGQTPGFFIDVTPDLAIPPVTQITKVRALATAAVSGGAVTNIVVTRAGAGYDPATPPAVSLAGGGGTGAAATAIVEPLTGSVTGIQITSPGTGYATAPTVSVAAAPTYQTQRTGGVLYQAGAYYGGDVLRFQTTVLNNRVASGTLQSRPMRTASADEFRLRTVLTVDPAYTAASPDDDLLVYEQVFFGDMGGFPTELSEIRTIKAYNTPPAVPTYGLPVTAPDQATATATVDAPSGGRVTAITVTAPGTYNPFLPPAVTIAGNGSGATAQAVVDPSGAITAINVVSPGIGYTAATVTIAPPVYGARYYQPLPDDGFLDIGEQIEIGYDVLMPQNYPGIYFVGAKIDALNQIAEPTGFAPGRESPPLDATALVNNNTFISDIATRVQLLSGPSPTVNMASQVSDTSGVPMLQSDGFSDISSIDEQGRYVVFESYSQDLAVPQADVATGLAGKNLPTNSVTGVPPVWSAFTTTEQAQFPSVGNGRKQIFRRNTATRVIDFMSLSSGGAQANADALNAFINATGKFVAFESQAANLVNNDTGGNSDIFIRSVEFFRTSRVSVNAAGIQGNASSFNPSLSRSGRFVCFESQATNLDPANPKTAGNTSMQVYVHDRDVSGSGTFDTAGNIRTYLVSVTPVGASQATATATVSAGRITSIAVTTGGSGYLSSTPPPVIISGGGGTGAAATAVVNGSGVVTSFIITNAGTGYTSTPTVTVAPRAPAADGWSNQARISADGNYVVFVSYSTNLPVAANGSAVGNPGYQGVIYRVQLQNGMPMPGTVQAVSIATGGALADALSYEPAINSAGTQIAFTSLATNLASDDNNGVPDVFVRDYTNTKTVRVSESLDRLAIGTISFVATGFGTSPANNNPADGDEFVLSDGINPAVTFTFRQAPAGPTEVLIGGSASQSRSNLVTAINAANAAGQLGLIAISDSPATPNPFYAPTFTIPGQAVDPGIALIATQTGAQANVEIGGNFLVVDSVNGINTSVLPSGVVVVTSGLRYGGTQADDDAGNFDGVPAGSTQPAIDEAGTLIAFRSTMQTMDVFDKTNTGTNGLRRGELMRMLRNASANVFVRQRNVGNQTPANYDTPGNVATTRVSVNRFGYRTSALANTPSSANSHKPFLSANGRYVTFSTDSENNGGLAFGRTNLDPQDTNGYRDVFVHDRNTTAEPPAVNVNNAPIATVTEPNWLAEYDLGVGSLIQLNAYATDADQELGLDNVRFYVNGNEVPATQKYGNYYSASYRFTSVSDSNSVIARVRDDSGAENNITTSLPVTFSTVTGIQSPIDIQLLSLPRGTILTVGQPTLLQARVNLPYLADINPIYDDIDFVAFYANGVLIGAVQIPSQTANYVAEFDWYPPTSGTVVLTAVAASFDSDSGGFSTLTSNSLPASTVLGVNEQPATGTPESMLLYLFQTVMLRPPTAEENSYYLNALSSGAMTPTQMVIQLVGMNEYDSLQNRLFEYYSRLTTSPVMTTYLQQLDLIAATTTPLPAANYPVQNTIASPYGATEGQADAAQAIVNSAAFATSNPGVQTMDNQTFMTWFFARMGGQLGSASELLTAMNANTSGTAKGQAVAFITALYRAATVQTAFQNQLKATSLQWLFTGAWTPPVQATATATIAAGKVTAVNPVNAGGGYLVGYSPTVSITGGGGTGAQATPVVSTTGQVTGFVVTNQGTGYTSAPTVTLGSPAVTTPAQLEAFVAVLLGNTTGQTTWSWVFANGLTGANALATANPKGDGIENLLKYAFNLNPNVAYSGPSSIITPTGSAGLPLVDTINVSGVDYLQITYVRRINENSIAYMPEFSSTLGDPMSWEDATNNPTTITPIDGIWERVTVRDSLPTSAVPARYGRVCVTESFWLP